MRQATCHQSCSDGVPHKSPTPSFPFFPPPRESASPDSNQRSSLPVLSSSLQPSQSQRRFLAGCWCRQQSPQLQSCLRSSRPHSAPAHAACLSIEISFTPLSAIAQLRYGSLLIAEYSMDARSESSCRAFSRRYGTCAVGAVHKSPHCFQEMTVFVCVFHRSRAFTVLSLCSRSYDTININLSGQ